MKVKVLGYLPCDFTEKSTGERVQGVSLKVMFKSSNENLVGHDVNKVWLPKDLIDYVGFTPSVDDELDLIYDYDGRRSFLESYKKVSQ